MIALLFFFLTLSAGYTIFSIFVPHSSFWLRLFAGLVIGIVFASWFTFLLGLAIGTTAALVCTSIGLLFISFFAVSRFRLPQFPWNGWLVFFGLIVLYTASSLYFGHALKVDAGGWFIPGYSWGDTPFHMSLISAVAYQSHPPLTFTVFYQAPLSYPFLFDFYSGLLLRLGLNWQLTLFLPNLGVFLAGAYISCALVKQVVGKASVAVLQLYLFLLAGSSWGIIVAIEDVWQKGKTQWFISDYSNMGDKALNFANPVTSHFLPQRSFVLGFAIVMIILLLLFRFAREKQEKRVLCLAALLTGALPFIHVHSFLIVVMSWGFYLFFRLLHGERITKWWWLALLFSCVLAFPQLWWQFHTTYHANFGRWYTGWMRPPNQSLLLFWVRNIGLALPLLLFIPWVARRIKSLQVWVLFTMMLVVTVACNVRIFQPNPFDNMKLLLYAYWALMIPVAWLIVWLWQKHWYILVVPMVAVLTGTGLLTIVREMQPNQSYLLFADQDIATANEMRSVLPETARVLTTSDHNNVIPALTGRDVLLGYQGWIWSYGINYADEESARYAVFYATPQAQVYIRKYSIGYIAISDQEALTYGVDVGFLQLNYTEIFNKNGWHIFQLSSQS